MKKISSLSRSGFFALAVLGVSPAHAAWTLNMSEGVTDLSAEVFGLHMLIFWICVVIGIGVFGLMLYSVIVHRKSRGFEASHFHESTVVEVAWTVVPFLILIAVAIPSAGTLLEVEDSSNPDMTIRVTGYQWLWGYDYVGTDVHFFSRLDSKSDQARQRGSGIDPNTVDHYLRNVDNPMVVPVDTKVRLLLTSGDVIHAWWVPELGGKKDAIPGYINDMWFKANETGTYRGQCAELCGRGHAFMPIVVKVVSKADYKSWIAKQGGGGTGSKPAADETAQAKDNEATSADQPSGEQGSDGQGAEGQEVAGNGAGEQNGGQGASQPGGDSAGADESSKGE